MLRELRASLLMLAALTVVTGVLYPLLVTGVARLVLPHQAGGSMLVSGGRVVGSELIGQAFADSGRFWGRPSATARTPYDASASTGSNLAIAQQPWRDLVAGRVAALRAADPFNNSPVPEDLVTASASGLDPDISPAAALYQVRRIAKDRAMSEEAVRRLVLRRVEGRTLGLLGEPRVNVLRLNLELDQMGQRNFPSHKPS